MTTYPPRSYLDLLARAKSHVRRVRNKAVLISTSSVTVGCSPTSFPDPFAWRGGRRNDPGIGQSWHKEILRFIILINFIIMQGAYLAHPEALLSENGRKRLNSETYQKNVVACFINEAHCVEMWYVGSTHNNFWMYIKSIGIILNKIKIGQINIQTILLCPDLISPLAVLPEDNASIVILLLFYN